MSITAETVKAHINDPAVLCCRAEEGTVLEPSNFEDPAIFPDLIDTGLLNTEGALSLGNIKMGETKLTKTVDSLTPITPEIVDTYNESFSEGGDESVEESAGESDAPEIAMSGEAHSVSLKASGGVLKLHIGEGRDIDIEMPL